MTDRNSARYRSDIGFWLCLAGPMAVVVVLNALVRPGLAGMLGGDRHSNGAGVRSNDVWWSFDATTQAQHPVLTSFLAVSDGLIAVCAIGVILLLFAARWLVRRRHRTRRATAGSTV
ncbi:MAG: hypothetical protein ACRDT9_17340 [Agromyces sp.]